MKNMTAGKPLKLIFLFAMPLMLGNMLQQLYTMVDTIIVGQYLGVDALASLGAADWINWMLLGIVMGFTQGFSIRISHTFGSQDFQAMEKILGNIFILCLVIASFLTVAAQFIIEPLLLVLNTPDNIINGSITYLRVMAGGVSIVMAYNCFSCILRALGNSRVPLFAMMGGAILNIVLDIWFVRYLNFGIAGAAFATLIAQASSASFCLYILIKELPFDISKKSFQPHYPMIVSLLKLATPLAFQNIIISIGGIIVQGVVNGFGFLFVAGFTITNKLYGLLEVAAISFGYAITTFNSQNYGAKQFHRMKDGIFQANILSLLTSLVISLLIILFGQDIIALFVSGSPQEVEQVMRISSQYLFVMAICLPVLYILHTYRSALQGMENTFIPMLSGIVELAMRVGVAIFLPIYIGQQGIYFAEVAAWFSSALLLFLSYRIKINELISKNMPSD